MHIVDDQYRIWIAEAFSHLAMCGHADFLPQLAQRGMFETFASRNAAAGEPPPGGIAKPDEDDPSLWRQRDRVHASPLLRASLHECECAGQHDAEQPVGQAGHMCLTVASGGGSHQSRAFL